MAASMPGQGTDEGATQRTAWDDPGTRAAHANLLRRALGLLFVGIVIFGVAAVLMTRSDRRAQELIDDGDRIDGIVTAFGSSGVRARRDQLDVRYVVEGVTYDLTIPSAREDYERGQQVVVFFDPDDPSDATLEGEAPQGGIEYAVSLTGFIGGLLLVPTAIVQLLRARLRKRVLGAGPWTEAWFTPDQQRTTIWLHPDQRVPAGTLPIVSLRLRHWKPLGMATGRPVLLRFVRSGGRVAVTPARSGGSLALGTTSPT